MYKSEDKTQTSFLDFSQSVGLYLSIVYYIKQL